MNICSPREDNLSYTFLQPILQYYKPSLKGRDTRRVRLPGVFLKGRGKSSSEDSDRKAETVSGGLPEVF